jgi:ankyrin repeat protein
MKNYLRNLRRNSIIFIFIPILVASGCIQMMEGGLGNSALNAAHKYAPDPVAAVDGTFRVYGADPNKRDVSGATRFMGVARGGNVKMAEVYVAHGADVNASDNSGWTPLMAACQAGQVAMVEFLIARGANVNASDKMGCTPLMAAAQIGDHRVVALLIDAKADINATSKDPAGFTAKDVAKANGHNKLVKLLQGTGAK